MTNIEQINQLENKVQDIQLIINNWKQEIIKYETVLSALIEEIKKLKEKDMKNNKRSPRGSNNNK